MVGVTYQEIHLFVEFLKEQYGQGRNASLLMKSLQTMIWELLRVGCQNLRSLMIGLAIRQAWLR
ncbi:TPA: hypothetical protein V1N32_002157 [Streptococcus pneumoniae]|nr:hypothetical protein [Streptococcus pneumoniae]